MTQQEERFAESAFICYYLKGSRSPLLSPIIREKGELSLLFIKKRTPHCLCQYKQKGGTILVDLSSLHQNGKRILVINKFTGQKSIKNSSLLNGSHPYFVIGNLLQEIKELK